MSEDSPTLVACLTPPGAGAIATLAVRGPQAWVAVRRLFRLAGTRSLPEETPEAGTLHFGYLGEAKLADEVVLCVKQREPVPWVEIHCHGGTQVVDWLLETLAAAGLNRCQWPEFQRQVESRLRAAALEQMARTTTTRTAAILLDQYSGAMERALADVRRCLARGDNEAARVLVGRLLAHAAVGQHLVDPWRVALAGAPNVGKSSLVNALAGYQRSIVAPIPGTTRDIVTTRLVIDGWPVEVSDTAGLHAASGGLERGGIELALSRVRQADLCIWVVDASAVPVWPENILSDARTLTIPVVNKIDLPAVWDLRQAPGALHVSAKTGAGISELCTAIANRLVPDPPGPGSAVPFLAELVAALRDCLRRIDAGAYTHGLAVLAEWT